VLTGLTQTLAATLVVTGSARIWMLVGIEAANGTVLAMTFPALTSIMPQLVPRGLLQQANALQSLARGGLRVLGPTVSALLVVAVGPGWALGVDAATWLVAAAVLGLVRLPPRPARESKTSTLQELRDGWVYVRSTTWLWVVVVGFGFLNAIHTGAWFTLGPARAKATIGEQGWGYLLSAESVGLILASVVLLRRPLQAPLRTGMFGVSLLSVPIFVLGWMPHLPLLIACAFVAGAGIELFNMGWNLAMQEHVPEQMLSRAYSYDALGSFLAMPVGQLAFGPLGARFGEHDVLMSSGVVYALLCCLVLTSGSVRRLRRSPSVAVRDQPE
jgi:MFS family permease